MRKDILLLLLLFFSTTAFGQKYTISGYVTDSATGEQLIGANVYDLNTLEGTTTNTYGFFSFTMEEDTVELVISYIGYQPYYKTVYLDADRKLNVALLSSVSLKEVEVTADRVEKIQERTQMSSVSIPIKQIKKLPAFMGEVDVLKALQLMPGVQSGNEGSSGLYVRGGSPDQNLILLDGVPVYNVSHLFGFFSVFNADAINNVQLIKGGFPARYGGRLSSVLEINMKEGNRNEFHGEGSLGIIASKLTLEGPIIKDKASFIVSGRRTYIDILARPLIKSQMEGDGIVGYYFYDLNGKVNYKISDKDRLYLSAYMGDDKFYFRDEQSYINNNVEYMDAFGGELSWGNLTSVLRWNHEFSQKLFSNVTLNYSQYKFLTAVSQESTETPPNQDPIHNSFNLNYFSGIKDWSTRIDFDYVPSPRHFLKFGANAIWHTFEPGATQFQSKQASFELDTTFNNEKIPAYEFAIYVEDDVKITNQLKANIGVHASAFSVRDEFYYSVQPRVSARYLINEFMSVKASYAMMAQYIHLLTNSGVGLPTDLWVPATDNVLPQNSHQVAGGFATTVKDLLEVSIEGYYKVMNNIIEFKPGTSFIGSEAGWEEKVASGTGWSYGGELFLQKKTGNTTGWVGYTLSWTEREFEEINFGERFPYKYDRRHDISVAISHEFNDKWEMSGTWVYGTGNATTLPLARYQAAGGLSGPFGYSEDIYSYGERNSYRMAAYHRMDFGVTYNKETKWGGYSFNLSVYNLYNRKNPFFIYEGTDSRGDREFKQVSLFPVLPSLSFNFHF